MLADGEYVDGSWLLSIHIDDLNIDREIRVYGEWSINELITQLIDGLTCPIPKSLNPNEISLRSNTVRSSWGDYGLWWPARSKWLLKTKSSLNQYGLQADAKLRFLSIYGNLNIQLPDLQIREFVDVNFAEPVFRVTLSICRYLNIRHPEELSLAHFIHQNDLKHSRFIPSSVDKRYHTLSNTGKRSTFQRSATINTTHSQYKTLRKESLFQTNEGTHTNVNDKHDEAKSEEQSIKSSTLSRHSIHLFGPPKIRDKRTHLHRYSRPDSGNFNKVPFSPIAFDLRIIDDSTLAFSPIMNVDDALQKGYIVKPNNYIQRIRLNGIWLDSSKSLLEQGIKMSGYSTVTNYQLNSPSVSRPNSPISSQNDEYTIPTLMLRYKYGIYYDLNIKYDLIRINQLYEQAKWSIISEINEVTNEEACLFAALQSQVELATEEETLMNDENLLNDNNNEEEQKGINGTIYTNDTQQLVNCSLDKSILDHCKTNVKKFKSTFIKHNRDISPLGGYLYHTGRYSMKSSSPSPSRPLSTIELDHEIDLMLDELSMNCLENTDSNLLTDGIKIQHCSRPKERLSRPLSLLNDTNHHHQSDIDSLMNNDQYDNHSNSLPELNTYVKICKPRKFGLKVFHRYYISVKGTELFVYKNKDDYLSNSDSAEVIYLPGCEIQSDLCISSEKFNLRLFVPVSRTNLPLSAAFAPCQSNGLQLDDEDPTVGSKLKRRASLLSLTSLSHLSNVLGISSSSSNNGAQNGPINISGIGALTGSSATMTGLINELCLRFSNLNDYIDWLTIFRITTSIHLILPSNLSTDITDLSSISIKTKKSSKKSRSIIITSLLNRTIFNNERKAITNLIQLLSPNSLKLDQPDKVINLTRLHHHLDKRLIHMLPLRLSYMKNSYHKTLDYRWDHLKDDTLMKHSGTLPNHDKPPIYSSHMNQFIQTRNHFIQHISSIYTQINNLSSIQSKLKYINVWEQLHFHGIAFFPARIEVTVPLNTLINGENDNDNGNGQTNWIPGMNRSSTMNNNHITISISRKIESIGIGSTRIYRCDLTNGEILASWRMSSIQSWHINWELSELVLNIAIQSNTVNTTTTTNTTNNTTTGRVIIRPIDVSVRMIAEFLGGYTFLNLRSPEKNQCLAEDIFYKLTTGMSQPFV